MQRSFKILSLLDGTSSLNQALQMNQSGYLNQAETPPMRLVPNESVNDMSAGRVAHPGQLISPDDMADSTWRSIVLQK